jgi:hypothetical protein
VAILWIVNLSTAQEPIIALTQKGVEKTFAAEGIGTGFVSIYIRIYTVQVFTEICITKHCYI